MSDTPLPCLDDAGLRRLARPAGAYPACAACAALVRPGWESLPSFADCSTLQRIATLRPPGDDEPTLDEHHPQGSNLWSADAPIASAFFPYNRCDLWQCSRCTRLFLRYTEYGGYYQDERIRAVDADRIAAP